MELQDGPPTSTLVGTDAIDHTTSPATAAMNMAANFYRDVQACANKHERQQLHRQYRDKILTIDQLGANIAAAFLPFLGPSGSREGGADAEQWSEFDRLAQRGKNMRDRQSQHIRHQSGVIAAWGGERFHYYGWEALPLPLLRQLHELAVLVPCWTDVVDLLNSKMLARHELRMLRGNNKALLIGEHSAASKVQNRHSPVERSDIISALEAARQRTTPLDLRQQMDLAAEKVKEASLGAFGLERDLYNMIVPSVNGDGLDETASSSSFSFSPTSQPPGGSVPLKVPKRIRSVPSSAQPSKRLAASSERRLTRAAVIHSDGEFSSQRGLGLRVQAEPPSYPTEASPPEHADSDSSSGDAVEVTETLDEAAGDEGADEPDCRPRRVQEPELRIEGRHESDNRDDEGTTCDNVGSNMEHDGANDNTTAQGEEMDIEPANEPDLEDMRRVEPESHDALQHMVTLSEGSYAVEVEALDALFHMSRENNSGQMQTQAHLDVTSPDIPAPQATGSSPGTSDRSSVEMPDASVVQAHPGVVDEPVPSRAFPTLLQTLRARYDPEISRFIGKLREPHTSDYAAPHRLLQLEWIEAQRWASIYVEPEHVLGRSCVASQQEADVWYLDWDTFRSYGESGFAFERPVVIKQRFQDRGMYNIAEYIDMLWQRFPEQEVLIQNSMMGTRNSMSVKDYCISVAEVDLSSPESAAPVSNVINLGRLAQADEPLLTRLPRFGLLYMLADRVAGVMGRSSQVKLSGVKGSLGFDMLGFSGAFSGSRMDPLVGSWVRCLAGFSIWAIATDLDAGDWQRFSRDGRDWSPEGKSRLIVLEQDDVLLMPPGLLAVHANLVPRRCLAEGGMLWDECKIPEIIEGLLYIVKNQQCVDMPPGIELGALVDSLEAWLDADDCIYPSPHGSNTSEYDQAVRASIQSLREML
ncbi:hypothetical protein NW754_007893 [Fusarium falciforme]|uniref:Uncharacterized protein n=1 Tax=Fusarium falciforme TaxID=195108 RepID=A0A9W8QXB1_9HYPO|nr:hypothetical protein NW754_007893 [Fusarium falciforme]KAJ4178972.1 hypothetical protein NW755_012801 [Fusarium falciforme]